MTSRATGGFWKCFESLPPGVRGIAKQKFLLWRNDPFHPSLQFKEIHSGLWSVRVNDQYRALARRRRDLLAWFWIGTHAEYDRLIRQS